MFSKKITTVIVNKLNLNFIHNFNPNFKYNLQKAIHLKNLRTYTNNSLVIFVILNSISRQSYIMLEDITLYNARK